MSDVLVMGMEMPKGCNVCRFMKFQCSGSVFCRCNGKRIEYSYSAMKKRPDWCPLVEVQTPHGRLIDADELNIHDISPVNGFCVMGVTEEEIGLADTVIEAERSEE